MPSPSPGPGPFLISIPSPALNPPTLISRLHIFDAEKDEFEATTVKVSHAPSLCAEYSPHNAHQLLVAGASNTVKVLDDRQLSDSKGAWKRKDAHRSAVRDVRFSPLIPHWVASAGDDGCVRVWDTRFVGPEVLCVQTYQCIISRIAWAHTHTEFLAAGGADNTLKLLSLRAAPQHIVACDHQSLSSQVVGLAASTTLAQQLFVALSTNAELGVMSVTPKFLEPLAVHRPAVAPEEAPVATFGVGSGGEQVWAGGGVVQLSTE